MTYVRKLYDAQVANEPGKRWVLARISTADVDRDGDVVLPSGGDFSQFEKNPVVMLRHGVGETPSLTKEQALPVGKAHGLRKRPNDIVATITFAERPASHPANLEWVPDTVHSLFQQSVLKAFSVGFMVPLGGFRKATTKDLDRFGDGARRVITKWRLIELSVVPVPSNQEALALAVSKGWMPEGSWLEQALRRSDDLLDLVEGSGDILDLDTTLEL